MNVVVFCEGISFGHIARAVLIAQMLKASKFEVIILGQERAVIEARTRGIMADIHLGCDSELIYKRLSGGKTAWLASEIVDLYRKDLSVLKNRKPALIVSEFRPTAVLAAQQLGVANLTIAEAPSHPSYRQPDVLPWSFCKPASMPNRWFDYIPRTKIGKLLIRKGWEAAIDPWNKAARSIGIAPRAHWSDYFAAGDAVLLADHPLLWPKFELRAKDFWLGALAWHAQGRMAVHVQKTSDSSNIYLSLGTQRSLDSRLAIDFAKALIKKGCRVYCSLGGRSESGSQLGSHPNLTIFSFVNESELFPSMDLVIHPGGNMTSWQAIRAGVPQLLIPVHAQQQFYASAIEAQGLGRWIRPRYSQIDQSIAIVLEMVRNDSIKIKARRAAEQVRSYKPEEQLLRCMEYLLDKANLARNEELYV